LQSKIQWELGTFFAGVWNPSRFTDKAMTDEIQLRSAIIYVFYSSKDRNTKSANPIKTNQKQTTLQQTKEKSGKIKINLT